MRMGKNYKNDISSRLSYGHSSSRPQQQAYSNDARLKLISTNNSILKRKNRSLDARDLISERKNEQHKQQKMLIEIENDIKKRTKSIQNSYDIVQDTLTVNTNSNLNRRQNHPKITVTGLSNVRLEGDKIKIINRSISNTNKMEAEDDEIIEIDKTRKPSDNSKYKNIRIKVDNEMAKSNIIKQQSSFENKNRVNVISSSFRRDVSNSDEENDQEMDYEVQESDSHRLKSSTSSNIKSSKNMSIDLQMNNGYKLLVSNLHHKVTEDDILELFSDIGPIKRARFLEKGVAEVVYVRLEDAQEAIEKYHKNELDGKPLIIELASSSAFGNDSSSRLRYSDQHVERSGKRTHSPQSSYRNDHVSEPQSNTFTSYLLKSSTSNSSQRNIQSFSTSPTNSPSTLTDSKLKPLSDRFKSLKNETIVLPESVVRMQKTNSNEKKINTVDPAIISQILFNNKPSLNSGPVTFTVKI